jgi:tetratricopeptide (TPR) repeat protein
MELLDQYEHGNPAAPAAFAGVIHVESVKNALHAEGEQWIEAAGPKEIPRRRLVAATFALETARAGLDHEWANSVDLIDWGWAQLRKERPPLPAERLWHLAAIALFQGAFDVDELETRIGRLKSRFPDEPYVVLTEGWLTANIAWRAVVRAPARLQIAGPSTISVAPSAPLRGKPGGVAQLDGSVSRAYAKALSSRAVAPEAHVRLAYYDLIADQHESALAHLAQAQSATTDRDVIYLAHLFRGWTLARMDRDAETTAEYQQAVDAVPGAGTGALWLAGRLLLEGKRAEADAVVDRSLVDSKDVEDPWRLFGYGDFFRFPAIMKQLRGAIR